MFVLAGLKRAWDAVSPWAKKENPVHAEFRQGVEQAMRANGIKDARMVGGFFQVGESFMKDLYGSGFRTSDNGQYDFDRAAVFVADVKVAGLDEDLTEGRSIAFMATQDKNGNVQLLNISNVARSSTLDTVNAYTARKAANRFRELLKVSGEQITPEFTGMYQAPAGVEPAFSGRAPAFQNI